MVIYKNIGNGLVKAYSDQGHMIHGGSPEGDYAEAIDPETAGRTYVETEEYVPTATDDGVRKWTPLSIKRASGDRWPVIRTALEEAGLFEDFIMAQELREDDSAFQQGITWAKSTYGEESVESVLSAASAMA